MVDKKRDGQPRDAKRRVMTYPMFRRTAGGENDAKSQVSLEMGTAEYRGYICDKMGVEEENFVEAGLVVDPRAARGEKLSDRDQERELAQDMGEEAEHVAGLAGELADAGESQLEQGADVAERKYRLRMAKADHVGEMKAELTRVAATTETKADDAIAKKVSTRTVDDLPDIHDDSVSEEEYVPGARRRYF